MPAAGGPNTLGESNLVFAYDTGDIRNSYIGEPTTNLALFSVVTGANFNADYAALTSQVVDYGVTYRGRPSLKCTSTGQWNLYKYPRSGNYTATSSTSFTFSWKMKWTDGRVPTFNNGYIYTDAQYFYNGVTATPLGDDWYLCQTVGGGTSSPIWLTGFNTSQYGTCYITDWQVEAKSHATSFTPAGATRSATQGLLPLVGNITLDLTAASYDSTSKISLDGSGDYIKASQNSNFYTNEWTWEIVTKFTSNTGTYQGLVWAEGATGGGSGYQYLLSLYNNTYFHYRISNTTTGWTNTNTANISFTPTNYNHIVWQFFNGTTQIYINGNLFHTDTSRGGYNGGTDSPLYIGARNDGALGAPMYPDIFKMYSRTLTAQEIKQNYQQYKTRFNLS